MKESPEGREIGQGLSAGDAGVEQYPRGVAVSFLPVAGLAGKGFPF
ncbi:hypothetical protein [Akkermansia muciniphila]|nr:hypothetical protein [Akkermansia muciniphila]